MPDGSFEVAKELMRDYEFADPAIVRAIYADDSPFETRDMLLEGRFYGLRFHFGVRVGGLVDDELTVDGRPARRWGWNYRTLQGHLEAGQMDYEVRKWLDSRRGRLPDPRLLPAGPHPQPGHPARFPAVRPLDPAPLRQARLPADGLPHRRQGQQLQ